jgi:hypothetical protein
VWPPPAVATHHVLLWYAKPGGVGSGDAGGRPCRHRGQVPPSMGTARGRCAAGGTAACHRTGGCVGLAGPAVTGRRPRPGDVKDEHFMIISPARFRRCPSSRRGVPCACTLHVHGPRLPARRRKAGAAQGVDRSSGMDFSAPPPEPRRREDVDHQREPCPHRIIDGTSPPRRPAGAAAAAARTGHWL